MANRFLLEPIYLLTEYRPRECDGMTAGAVGTLLDRAFVGPTRSDAIDSLVSMLHDVPATR